MVTTAAARLRLQVDVESWEMAAPFRITGYTFTHSKVAVARISDGRFEGRGEAFGVYYFGDTPELLAAQIETVREAVEGGVSRAALRGLLPPGGARNALDCALWDLEAQQSGEPVWRLAGLPALKPLLTTHTLGADDPEVMAAGAVGKYANARALKLKLLGDGIDGERVAAVRAARPDVWLGVDANQGFTRASLEALLPSFVASRVSLVEQPLPIGQEAELDGLVSPIPLAADESVQGLDDVAGLVGRFDVVNIKLDKCGGLTEALMMAHKARELGLQVMVGNMSGTSLAMAPALVVGQLCDVVDLDGPLFLKTDRKPSVSYKDGYVHAPEGLWG